MPTMIRLSRCAQLAFLLSSFTNASMPESLSPPPPAPPCTVDMLKARPAGDKNWPVACSNTTLGDAGEELDLSGSELIAEGEVIERGNRTPPLLWPT